MSDGTYGSLLKRGGFQSYLWTQFLGAFNDNVSKWIVTLYAIDMARGEGSLYSALVGGVFVLPFLLFSNYAGRIADSYSKRSLIIGVKVFEIASMAFGFWAFSSGHLRMLLAVPFLMGLHSTFFSPAKYGILPEMLPEKDLSRANGLLETTTFMAIVLGTSLGGLLYAHWNTTPGKLNLVLVAVAVAGFFLSLGVEKVKPAAPGTPFSWNPFSGSLTGLREIRKDKTLWLTSLGVSYFWLLGAFLMSVVGPLGKEVMLLNNQDTALLETFLAVGIGLGSLLAGKLSGDRVELGLVPLGSIGLGVFAILTALFAPHSTPATMACLTLLGVSGGLFAVPLNAMLQQKSDVHHKGRIQATNNLLNSIGMILAFGILALLGGPLALSADKSLIVMAVLTFAATGYILTLLPNALLRFVLWTVTHTVYRVKIVNPQAVPVQGPALLVCNHVSHVDGILLGTTVDRPVRFMVWKPYTEIFWLKWLFRIMGAIPTGNRTPREAVESIHIAREALKNGEAVCIFAEGAISRTGNLHPFKRGFERIVEGLDVPIIPVSLDNLWGSIFSFKDGKFFFKKPERVPYPVTLSFGPPLPKGAPADSVRLAVMELGAEAWDHRRKSTDTLANRLVITTRKHPFRRTVADTSGNKLNYLKFLSASILLARWLEKNRKGETHIGLEVPATVGGALANAAVTLAGRAAVNLNFTLGPEVQKACADKCGLKTVLTSRKFLEKANLPSPEHAVYLEDIVSGFGPLRKLGAFMAAWWMPRHSLLKWTGASRVHSQDTATVIFSSGSTSVPKGIELSHHNILSNLEGLEQIFWVTEKDLLAGVLPFFHSFGYTASLWFPLLSAFPVVFHPNPLDAKMVGSLVKKNKATFLMATPTFFQAYVKRCDAADFATLRFPMAGAEKLRASTSEEFKAKFGVELMEGYGSTEMSPVVAVNTHDYESAHSKQKGHKPGTVGQPLPGVAVKIVDPTSHVALPLGQEGLLLVKGPNRMKGYYGDESATREVVKDGWYVTGDLGHLDGDGFLTLTGRMSRFSKVAGEMVPHGKVEQALMDLYPSQGFAVTGVSDEQKGERLVVIHTDPALDVEATGKALAATGLPNLWIPKRDAYYFVEQLPLLGSGKLDLRRLQALAVEFTAKTEAL